MYQIDSNTLVDFNKQLNMESWQGYSQHIAFFLFQHLTANDISPVLMSRKTHNAHLYVTMPSLQIRMIEPGGHMGKTEKMVDMCKTKFYAFDPCTSEMQ
jgi:hypothetical protein